MRLICFCFLLTLMGISLSSGQTAQDVPLTLESFRNLTPQEGARQLIGPSAELVSKMILGAPLCCRSLSWVRLYLRPTAVRIGLCMENELDVHLNPVDGTPLRDSGASTVMKIASIDLIHEFAVVGDLAGESSPDQTAAVEARCGDLHPFKLFVASSSDEAWEGAYLAELALKQAASDGPGKTRINCHLGLSCGPAYGRLTRLSTTELSFAAAAEDQGKEPPSATA